jgi:uncharacterized protein YjiS (DUF1127 family)
MMTRSIPDTTRPSLPPRRSLASLGARYHHWRQRRRRFGEVARAQALGGFDSILADLGMTRSEFDVLMTAPEDAGREFEIMAGMAGVDLQTLPPSVLRSAISTCVLCPSARACRKWLRSGIWKGGDPRCPNAALLRHGTALPPA